MDRYTDAFLSVPALDVFLSAIAMFIVGMLWYTVLFGKTYKNIMVAQGKSEEEICKKPSSGTMLKGFIAHLALCYLIGLIDVHANGNATAIYVSVVAIWLFTMLDVIHGVIWEKMPFKLFLIYTGNTLANYLTAGTIFWLIEN